MCGIFLATSKSSYEQLKLANSDRGLIYSHDVIVAHGEPTVEFMVGHILQATNPSEQHSHPSVIGETKLWHNGLIKKRFMTQHDYSGWDTTLLHKLVMGHFDGKQTLDHVDGSFACVYYNGTSLYFFRNQMSPLFVSDNHTAPLALSSVKTILTPHSVTSGTIYEITSETSYEVASTFTTTDVY